MKNITAGLFLVLLCVIISLVYNKNQKNESTNMPKWENWEIKDEFQPKEEVKPDLNNYEKALIQSKNTGKKIVLFFTADWCSVCERMKKHTLNTREVANKLEKFIFLEIDANKHPELVLKYNAFTFPTYVMTDFSETTKKKGQGYANRDEFLVWLEGKNPKLERPG